MGNPPRAPLHAAPEIRPPPTTRTGEPIAPVVDEALGVDHVTRTNPLRPASHAHRPARPPVWIPSTRSRGMHSLHTAQDAYHADSMNVQGVSIPTPWTYSAVLLIAVLALSGCYRAPLATAGPEGCGTAPAERLAMALNQARASRDLEPLEVDARLAGAARRHSDDMAAHRFLGHRGHDGSTHQDRVREAAYHGGAGEVVAAGQRTAEKAVAGWLRSRRHRQILLLGSATDVGGACARDGRGVLYWTVLVGVPAQPPIPSPPASMRLDAWTAARPDA